MNPIIQNILAVIAGFVTFSIVNMGIILVGGLIIPPPEGVNVNDYESLQAAMPMFELKHFITPFLAHAVGALIGAWTTALIAKSHQLTLALIAGCFFLLGGIINSFLLLPPVWFIVLDLVAAYIPMSWLGWKLSGRE